MSFNIMYDTVVELSRLGNEEASRAIQDYRKAKTWEEQDMATCRIEHVYLSNTKDTDFKRGSNENTSKS